MFHGNPCDETALEIFDDMMDETLMGSMTQRILDF
jgi:hypothetical protein